MLGRDGRPFPAPPLRALAAAVVLSAAAAAGGDDAAGAAVEEVAVLETPQGAVVWRFLDEDAPGHAAYVRELIRRGFYDGTTIHRVIPHFVIQGGDPLSRNDDRSDDGDGEADRRLKAEFSSTLHYRPGTVGMARDADPDSGSCQFFIALESLPRLDGRYTIFGEVISGLDVARRIADLPRDLNDNPLERVPIRARLERREVPERVVSLEAGPSGEVLTGPDRPSFYDPGNVHWKPPVLRTPPPGAPAGPARLDLAVSEDGRVLDVRFPEAATPGAALLRERALSWSFEPATYEGRPRKVRFEIGSDGAAIGPSTGGGAPVAVTDGVTPPRTAVRVDLPPGRKAPARPALLRLTIDPSGTVSEAAVQSSCGEGDLDAAAAEAARRLIFSPAVRTVAGKKDPQPVAVHVEVEARFVEPAS